MKKLATAFAACMLAGLVSAQVQSQNIVGYNSITLDKQWSILGVNFAAVGGGNIALQDAFPYVSGMTKAHAFVSADQIQVQNASGTYDTYYMSDGYNAKGTIYTGTLDGKWALAGQFTPATNTLAAGTAFWFYRVSYASPLTLTVAGQVNLLETCDKQIPLKWSHIANPYACDLPLNDGIVYTNGMTKAHAFTSADQIQIQNASGTYDTYYMSDGYNAKGTIYTATLDGKWALAGQFTPATASIPMGKGAWYYRQGATAFTVTIARPYSL